MEVLFLIFHGFEPSNGISKKISYQLNAFKANGHETHLCYMDEAVSKQRIVDNQVIIDYGNGIKGKILKRTEFNSIVNYAIDNKIDLVYIRSNHNANPFTIHMVKRMKGAGMKVVMEIPTYPYDQEYFNKSMRRQLIQDKLFRKQYAKHLDGIVTFSEEDFIFGQKTIKISNGIDFESVRIKKTSDHSNDELHLIGVAEIHRWHGFDRILKGLANYYTSPRKLKVYFHLVGYFFSYVEEDEITTIIRDSQLEPYVILHGKKHGEELDNIFDKCDFGVGSLGRHRVGINDIKTLKNREYAARGIPFVYSETDKDFDKQPYVLKMLADESPINIEEIISFYQQLTTTPQQIRDSIEHLSWTNQMKRVLDAVYPLEQHNRIRLAYCIPSLDHSGGMERVLTTKANYLADILNYEVNIIITDNKGSKPYFPLSEKVNLIQLDVNIDNLWQYPIWKRLYLYSKKMKDYKRKLNICLNSLKPDITISLLRREINFLCDIKDGSAKIGEIHFGRYKYREANFDFLPPFVNRWITNKWMAQLDKKVKQLDRFIVLTHEDSTYWKGLDNLKVIANPITLSDNSQCSDYSSKSAIAVGRYTYQKGFDLLISAWKKVNEKHPDWQLDIYGGGDREYYQELVNKIGLQDVVKCNGPVTNIAEKYQNSSIFVLSSRFEGLPLVLMEAMSAGLAPVAFACPCGPKDIIKDGENGLLCINGNTEELALKICELIKNERMRIQIGQNAADSIKNYSLVNIMHQWNNLFQEIYKNHAKEA